MSDDVMISVKEITRLKVEPGETLVIHIDKDKASKETVKNVSRCFEHMGFSNIIIDTLGTTFSSIKVKNAKN